VKELKEMNRSHMGRRTECHGEMSEQMSEEAAKSESADGQNLDFENLE
jgi:hypothetical protein